jgi:formate dehydrogenase subunit gamma
MKRRWANMSKMVRKASTAEILNHWVLAISCILLSISGFGFLFKIEFIGSLFGGFNLMKTIHNWVGVAFSVSLFFSMFNWLKESLAFDSDDIGWIKVAGGYLSHKVKVPPMGKLNTGQKFYYIALLFFGMAISISGYIIWLLPGSRNWVLISHLIHNISFDVLMIAIPVHMYLASIANPGTFRIMVSGTVPLEWAKKKHPKWIHEEGLD